MNAINFNGREVPYYTDATGVDDKQFSKQQMVDLFEKVYVTNRWRKGEGAGSESITKNAQVWMKHLFEAVDQYKPTTLHDFGCGPYALFKEHTWPEYVIYSGFDVSETALIRAENNCTNPKYSFIKLEDYDNLPGGDMLFVKGVFQHWPHEPRVDFMEKAVKKYKVIMIQGAATCTLPSEWREKASFEHIYPHESKPQHPVGIWKFETELLKG